MPWVTSPLRGAVGKKEGIEMKEAHSWAQMEETQDEKTVLGEGKAETTGTPNNPATRSPSQPWPGSTQISLEEGTCG